MYYFINCNWEKSNQFQKNPSTIIDGKDGYKTRECFLKSFEEGISYWNNFKTEVTTEYEHYSFTLSNMLESRWGYGAMHPGTFPMIELYQVVWKRTDILQLQISCCHQ